MKTAASALEASTAPFVAGSDEVGYGAWAGPLCVASVVVPRKWVGPKGLTDSKRMTRKSLERVHAEFKRLPVYPEGGGQVWWSISYASSDEIDRDGVGPTLRAMHAGAMGRAIRMGQLMGAGEPPLAIVDGNMNIEGCISIPKADLLFPAVSMASVLAKVARDQIMRNYDTEFPGYGFADHVGYGTAKHIKALDRLGPCEIHRKSYKPVAARQHACQPMWAAFDE